MARIFRIIELLLKYRLKYYYSTHYKLSKFKKYINFIC